MSDEGYLLNNQASEAGWRLDAVATLFDPSPSVTSRPQAGAPLGTVLRTQAL